LRTFFPAIDLVLEIKIFYNKYVNRDEGLSLVRKGLTNEVMLFLFTLKCTKKVERLERIWNDIICGSLVLWRSGNDIATITLLWEMHGRIQKRRNKNKVEL
jgi:hypothetical protein